MERPSPVIEIRGITKKIDGKPILQGIDLSVHPGEILGILGPNGAGKTSLLNCLAGLWSPGEGSISIDGLDRYRDSEQVRRFTFFLPDRPFAHAHETGRDHLELIARVYQVPDGLARRRIENLVETFDLGEVFDEVAATYSNGQYRKLCMAGALVSGARVLIMDEPFTGEVDPPGTANFKVILKELTAKKGVTVVITTQIVSLAEELCHRVAILHGGQLRALDSPAAIAAAFGHEGQGLEPVFWDITGKKSVAAGLDFVDSVDGSRAGSPAGLP